MGGRSTVVQLKKVLGKGDKSAMRFIYKDLGWIWVRAEESGRRSTTSECCGEIPASLQNFCADKLFPKM